MLIVSSTEFKKKRNAKCANSKMKIPSKWALINRAGLDDIEAVRL